MSKKMIDIGGTYFHPYSIIAVTNYVVENNLIPGRCAIWCGPAKGDDFIVSIEKEEAVEIINDWLEEDGI